jgi:hypothetical protein
MVQSRYKILRRVVVLTTGTVAAMIAVGLWTLRAVPAHGDEPPPGYTSTSFLKLAYATGQLQLVDRELPIPDTVEVTRGVEYGQGGDVSLQLDVYAPKGLKQQAPGLVFTTTECGSPKKGMSLRQSLIDFGMSRCTRLLCRMRNAPFDGCGSMRRRITSIRTGLPWLADPREGICQ